jgi:hypothetical protein
MSSTSFKTAMSTSYHWLQNTSEISLGDANTWQHFSTHYEKVVTPLTEDILTTFSVPTNIVLLTLITINERNETEWIHIEFECHKVNHKQFWLVLVLRCWCWYQSASPEVYLIVSYSLDTVPLSLVLMPALLLNALSAKGKQRKHDASSEIS